MGVVGPAVHLREDGPEERLSLRTPHQVVLEEVTLDVEDELLAGEHGAGGLLVERGLRRDVPAAAKDASCGLPGAGLERQQRRRRPAERAQERRPREARVPRVLLAGAPRPADRLTLDGRQRCGHILAVRAGTELDGQPGIVVLHELDTPWTAREVPRVSAPWTSNLVSFVKPVWDGAIGPRRACLGGARRSGRVGLGSRGLFRTHWGRAFRAAYLVTRDTAAAEDIAQESLLAALRLTGSTARQSSPFLPPKGANHGPQSFSLQMGSFLGTTMGAVIALADLSGRHPRG